MRELPIELYSPHAAPGFPPASRALATPNGLLAAGGALTPDWLIEAYTHGIFPWFGENEPILWWSPDPRCVFATEHIHISRSLRKFLRHCNWSIHADRDFEAVIRACAAPRGNHAGTWLTDAMIDAYCELHRIGHAHSIEVHDGPRLVGGLYGVSTGKLFCGESMFSALSGGSKVALLAAGHVLSGWGCPLLDAQVPNDHLLRMGAHFISRADFLTALTDPARPDLPAGSWADHWPALKAHDLC